MKLIKIIMIALCSVCIICFGVYQLVFRSHFGARKVGDIRSLLITDEFPAGWEIDYVQPITGDYEAGEENLIAAFTLNNDQGYAYQYVYRFNNPLMAYYSNLYLESRLMPKPGENPDNAIYVSKVADTWDLYCRQNSLGGPNCNLLARYGNLITHLSFTVSKDKIMPDQILGLLQAIDERFSTN